VRALAGHARDFSAHAGRVRLRGRANLIIFSTLKKQENEYADTCFAGAVRPRVAFCAWRVRELCTRRVVTKPFAAQTLRAVGVNRAHSADLGEDATKGPVTCCLFIFFLWAFSQTISSCFYKRDSCFQFNRPIPLYQPKIPWSNNSRTEIIVTLRALRHRLRSPASEKTLFTVVI